MPIYLYRGYDLLIQDIEGRLAQEGFSRTDEVKDADFVITYCTNLTELEDLYFDTGGLVQEAVSSKVIIDLSPCTPNLANEISGICAVGNIGFVSAPLNAIDKVTQDALCRDNLTCFAGGEKGAVKEAMPILSAVFSSVQEVSSAASAQLLHASQSIYSICQMVSVIETLSLAKACKSSVNPVDANIDKVAWPPQVSEIVCAVQNESFTSNYTVEMVLAELSAAMMSGDDYEMILPQTESAFHLFELLAVIGGVSMSPAALSLVYAGDQVGESHGLDWSRAETLYGSGVADDAIDDYEADEMDVDHDDIFGRGFGYSIN